MISVDIKAVCHDGRLFASIDDLADSFDVDARLNAGRVDHVDAVLRAVAEQIRNLKED